MKFWLTYFHVQSQGSDLKREPSVLIKFKGTLGHIKSLTYANLVDKERTIIKLLTLGTNVSCIDTHALPEQLYYDFLVPSLKNYK
jgi:hypothetical protein